MHACASRPGDTAPAATGNGPYFGICTRVSDQNVCVTSWSMWERWLHFNLHSRTSEWRDTRTKIVKRRRVLVRPVRSFHCTAYWDLRRRNSRLSRRLFNLHYPTCCRTSTEVEAFHVPRSTGIGLHTPGTGQSWRLIIHQLQRRRKNENERYFLCCELKLEGSCCILANFWKVAKHSLIPWSCVRKKEKRHSKTKKKNRWHWSSAKCADKNCVLLCRSNRVCFHEWGF